MARFTISGRSTIAPTNALPGVSLYATAGVRPVVREVGVFNTTVTAFLAALNRLTTLGTAGAGLTEAKETDTTQAAVSTGFAGHTVGPTITDEIRRYSCGAAIGSGIVWTFGDRGLVIPNTTADGLGIICPTGTGQVFDYYISWDE